MSTKKIAVCASAQNANDFVSDRFARCECYAIYENGEFSFVENDAKKEMGGAGSKAAKQLGGLGIDVVLVPEIGPHAFDALAAFEVEVFQYESKNISLKDCVAAYTEGNLIPVQGYTVPGKH